MDLKKEFVQRKIKQETETEPYNIIPEVFVSPTNSLEIKFEDPTYANDEIEDHIEHTLDAIVNGHTEEPNQLKECKNVPLTKTIDVEIINNRQICRLCAEPITSTEIFLYEDGDLEQKINYTLPITMANGDGLPEYICRNCEINLSMFYDFVCLVENADKKLRARDVKSNATIKEIFGADLNEVEQTEEEANRSETSDPEHLCDLKVPTIKVTDKKPNKNLLYDDDNDKPRKIQKLSISDPLLLQKPNEQYKCLKCDQFFPDYFALVHHSKQSHEKVRYPCPETQCSGIYPTEKSLRQHINVDHNVPVICYKCGKLFVHQEALQKHKDNFHFFKVCDNCGMSFKSSLSFTTHRLLHGEVSEGQCVYCYKNFKNRHKLFRHTRQRHSGNFTLLVDSHEDDVGKSLLNHSK